MKTKFVVWLGLVLVMSALMAGCSGPTPNAELEPVVSESIEVETTTPTAVTEEPTPVEVANTQAPTASQTEMEEPTPTESVATEESIATGPRAGDLAPDFTLPDSEGNMVNLAEELQENQSVILVFYFEYG